MRWYHRVAQDQNTLPDALAYYEKEYADARKELDVKGMRIEEVARRLPGLVEYRFGQLQDIEAILSYFELRVEKAASEAKKRYMENYQRALSDRTAEKFGENDQDVYDLKCLILEIALVRNSFLSITKGMEYLHFQLTNIVRLRQAGIEDSTF